MIIKITEEMINQSIRNVEEKLKKGKQAVKVYDGGDNEKYLLNNFVGELGELTFSKAIDELGHEKGVVPHDLEVFMNSDVCDMFSSKTAMPIDVKTTKNRDRGLVLNRKVSDWKDTYAYVLVNLNARVETLKDFYKVKSATIAGYMPDSLIRQQKNIRQMYGRDVYLVEKRNLLPIESFLEKHFFKKNEQVQEYHSNGNLYLEVNSIEQNLPTNVPIKDLFKNKNPYKVESGVYNFIPFRYRDKIISLAIRKNTLYPILLLKAILYGETVAREEERTLVIPFKILNLLSEKDKVRFMMIISKMKCNVMLKC